MTANDQQGRGDTSISGARLLAADRLGEAGLEQLAHELRTPLAAIQSMAEALCGGHLGLMENSRHAGYVQSIAETAKHALAVVDAMLLRPLGETKEVEDVSCGLDVAAVARDVVAGMAVLAARAGVRLEVRDSGGSGPHAKACGTDVRQMLINLVSNGIMHAGGGATVRVETGSQDGVVWVAVTDDGSGIPQIVLDRLEMGLPLDVVANGASASRMRLGLMLTRSLADANGGRLEIETGADGTRARVLLPASD